MDRIKCKNEEFKYFLFYPQSLPICRCHRAEARERRRGIASIHLVSWNLLHLRSCGIIAEREVKLEPSERDGPRPPCLASLRSRGRSCVGSRALGTSSFRFPPRLCAACGCRGNRDRTDDPRSLWFPIHLAPPQPARHKALLHAPRDRARSNSTPPVLPGTTEIRTETKPPQGPRGVALVEMKCRACQFPGGWGAIIHIRVLPSLPPRNTTNSLPHVSPSSCT